MSDPVESRDVEDVLANIRKLVSVEQPPALRRDRSRLVLTSELRVEGEEPQKVLVPKDAEIEPQDAGALADGADDQPNNQETADRDGGPIEPLADDVSDAMSEDTSGPLASNDAEVADPATADDPGLEDETISAIEAAIASSDDSSTDESGDARDEDEADASDEIDYEDETAQAASWLRGVSGTEGEPSDPAENTAEEVAEDEAQPIHRHPYRQSAARPSWAEDASADMRRVEDPDQPSETDPAEAATLDAERHDRDDLWDNRGGFDLDDGEDAFLDEEALRDLVAEVVREELAGALGERITRNVKKLVRREIMRALAARDFE